MSLELRLAPLKTEPLASDPQCRRFCCLCRLFKSSVTSCSYPFYFVIWNSNFWVLDRVPPMITDNTSSTSNGDSIRGTFSAYNSSSAFFTSGTRTISLIHLYPNPLVFLFDLTRIFTFFEIRGALKSLDWRTMNSFSDLVSGMCFWAIYGAGTRMCCACSDLLLSGHLTS